MNAFTQRAVGKNIADGGNICSCSEIEGKEGAYININDGDQVKLCGYMNKGGNSYDSFAVFAFTQPQPPTP